MTLLNDISVNSKVIPLASESFTTSCYFPVHNIAVEFLVKCSLITVVSIQVEGNKTTVCYLGPGSGLHDVCLSNLLQRTVNLVGDYKRKNCMGKQTVPTPNTSDY